VNLPRLSLFGALAIINLVFVYRWWRLRRSQMKRDRPAWDDIVIGIVTDFLDGLGIGSFAPTTALYKLRRRPVDELIPGTLNIGHNAAAFIETVVFVTTVAVEPVLLVLMVASGALGAWLGAGIVSRMSRRTVQFWMGAALLVAAAIFVMSNLGLVPAGGTAMGLDGWRFGLAVSLNFVFGALMSVGIGAYAPIMAMLFLLGMSPIASYPIMMGTCGIVQPAAGLRFFKAQRFAWGPALGLIIGGTIGVLVAIYVVKTLPLRVLRWLVVVVVSYAAVSMLRSALGARQLAPAAGAVP
jgi:uncharacterized membrane protein YfcA